MKFTRDEGEKALQEVLFQTENLGYNNIIKYDDVTIPKGKVTFISGESGTGKSTLLKLLNGILTSSSGRIIYEGRDLSEFDTIELRKRVSLVSQDVFLFDTTIEQNFIRFYEYRDQSPPGTDEMKRFLALCGVPLSLDKDCTTMSGGERQRVYIAIFLSFLPKVIMLDEPTSALDQKNSGIVLENIISFCKKNDMTIIIVSHDQALKDRFAEQNIVIKERVL